MADQRPATTGKSVGSDDIQNLTIIIEEHRRESEKKLLQHMRDVILSNAEYVPRVIHKKEQKVRGIPLVTGMQHNALTDKNRYPVGRFLIEVKELRNFDWESKGIFVRLSSHPYVFESAAVDKGVNGAHSFQQAFCFPLHNYFECLNLHVLVKRQLRLFKNKRRQETVIAKFQLPIPDLNSHLPLRARQVTLQLPLDEGLNYKKLGLVATQQSKGMAHLLVTVTDLTKPLAAITDSPNRSVIEHKYQNPKYIGFGEMMQVVQRLGFVRQHWNYWRQADHFIFQWHYPRFSRVASVVLITAIYFFRAENLLSYLVAAVIARALWRSEEAGDLQRRFDKMFFQPHHRHPMLQTANAITPEIPRRQPPPFRPDTFAVERQKESVLAKIARFKGSVAKAFNFADKYCCYFEKFKNVIEWSDQKATWVFICAMLLLFILVTFLPIRAMIIAGVINRFYRGHRWNERRYTSNRELCKLELTKLFETIKIDIAREGEQIQRSTLPNTPLEELDWTWQAILKAKNYWHRMKVSQFESKLIAHFSSQFEIRIPKDLLRTECKNPRDLIEYFGHTGFVLHAKVIYDMDQHLANPKIYHRVTPLWQTAGVFVMNRVPSDLYRARVEKMKVRPAPNGQLIVGDGVQTVIEEEDYGQEDWVDVQAPDESPTLHALDPENWDIDSDEHAAIEQHEMLAAGEDDTEYFDF